MAPSTLSVGTAVQFHVDWSINTQSTRSYSARGWITIQHHPLKAPKKATAAATIGTPAPSLDEEETGFSSFSTFTTAGEHGNHMSAFPTISTPPSSRRLRRSTTYAMIGRLQAMATGGADSLGPYDGLLDTAANCSVVRNKTLLDNLHRCQAVNFDGIGGTLAISK